MTKDNTKSNAQAAVNVAQSTGQLTGPGSVAPCNLMKLDRHVNGIVMKRKHIDIFGDDKYGHWWFEIDNNESYGWWPVKKPVGAGDTFGGTPGELNGQTNFGGTASRDPHHGDPAEDTFTPVIPLSDMRTDAQVKDCLRSFARSYHGEWRWTFGNGQN
ncbi:hypothetical protein, partial [Azospirillum argentinense]